VLLIIVALTATVLQPVLLAGESPTLDDGVITGAEIEVEGYWFTRPDTTCPDCWLPDYPQTDSTGPFKVRAEITPNSGVASVVLYHSIDGASFSKVPMTISGLVASGKISKRKIQGIGVWRLRFYLRVYNEYGELLEIDEIPTAEGGDPYNIRIVLPAPFSGLWERENHKPKDPLLRIEPPDRVLSSWHGVLDWQYVVVYVGPKGDIAVPPEYATLLKPDYVETSTHSFEYDKSGRLYVWGPTVNAVYVRVGNRP
jgi:hypothetical protein